jgi:tRNA-Thr(GGU) m(6)t(6)A37 methyltransferase TsaA
MRASSAAPAGVLPLTDVVSALQVPTNPSSSELDFDPRTREVAELCAFQREALEGLEAELAALDTQIAATESVIRDGRNNVCALRGLMQARGSYAQVKEQVYAAQAERRGRDSRGRETQIRWKDASVSPGLIYSAVGAKTSGSKRGSGGDGASGQRDESCPSMPTCGTVYSQFFKRFEAPRQSFQGPAGQAVVVLEDAGDEATQSVLRDVLPGSRVWLVYWLDRNAGFWREQVRPPRAKGGWRVGLFATRSPHRPTPVGLSLAEVIDVQKTELSTRISVRGVDILDETPLVAWRLYDPASEAHTDVKSGWLDDTDKLQPLYYDEAGCDSAGFGDGNDRGRDTPEILMSDLVREKLTYIDNSSSINLFAMLQSTLSRVHAGVSNENKGASGKHRETLDGRSEFKPVSDDADAVKESVYPVGAWRVWYAWDAEMERVRITNVTSGIREEVFLKEGSIDREAREHRDFTFRFELA